ncbi:9299_t:CDS:10 [Paraglomus brasilianum]|uniref:9299_t:CDS:1 n=1 Tax=Paraglomus brasilianum TaxID=144538 RepID=A0A9N9CGV4_9GLOM|nr:9299_t:CDS:10 [Paraglomus brasilianum]
MNSIRSIQRLGAFVGATSVRTSLLRNAAVVPMLMRRQTSTSAAANEHEQILQQQRAVRPLSPHLQIYQPQLTWILSIAHRFSGAGVATVLYGSAIAYAIGPYLGSPWDADTLVAAVSTLPPSVVLAGKASLAFPFTFHTFNGIRHLIWDTGRSLTVKGVYITGWTKRLTKTLNLHPSYFGPDMHENLKNRLYVDVEGTCTGRYGYIIAVVKIENYSQGKVLPSLGLAEFTITYMAIVFKPFRGEVVDGTVTQVIKMGFFADVGPLQVFVSNHLIPSEYTFDPHANPPAYIGEDQPTIERGSCVRMKIVGTRFDATDIFAIGTIKDDFLGVIDR